MSAPSQPQHRIFISHSHIDNEFGTRLAQDLRRVLEDESAVWYDVLGGLHGGDTWWEKIVEELTSRPGTSRTQGKESASFRCCTESALYVPISILSRSSPFSLPKSMKMHSKECWLL
jgi:hypothetical protein